MTQNQYSPDATPEQIAAYEAFLLTDEGKVADRRRRIYEILHPPKEPNAPIFYNYDNQAEYEHARQRTHTAERIVALEDEIVALKQQFETLKTRLDKLPKTSQGGAA